MNQQQALIVKTLGGLIVVAVMLTIAGSPVWGLSPLVMVAAAGFAAAAVATTLGPPER